MFSVVLPFLKFRVYEPKANMLAEVTVTPYRNLMEAVTVYGQDFSGAVVQSISSSKIIIGLYLLGLVVFLGHFIFKITQLTLLIYRNKTEQVGSVKFVALDKEFSPFSFLSYIFINPELKNDLGYEKMVAHEMEHIKQGHSFDVLILELLAVFQWFNPFMWILKRVIRENHEFLADKAVLESGISSAHYKMLLLNQAVGFQLDIPNSFNASLVKSRIKMISKMQSSKFANIKYAVGIISVLVLIIVFACEQKQAIQYQEAEENVNTKEVENKGIQVLFDNDKLKFEGSDDNIKKIQNYLSGADKLELESDSAGNIYLVKANNDISIQNNLKKIKSTAQKEIPEQIVQQAKQASLETIESKAAESVVEPTVTVVAHSKRKVAENKETVFFIVEEMPEFPGGDLALRKFIAGSIKYPVVAQENGIQGKVYVTFVVSETGHVKGARIARGVDPSLDKEAMRVVSSLPRWKPGYQKGIAVNVSYTVPINFVLQ